MNRFLAAFLGLCSLGVVQAAVVQAPARIHARIEEDHLTRLTGNVSPRIAKARSLGAVASDLELHMTMRFQMSQQQSEDLDQFLRQLQKPGAENYHKFLTPEQFGARFGMNPSDIAKIQGWLEQQGFTNVEIARSRTFVKFAGSASTVESAFHTELRRYSLHGETHYANATDPQLPFALSGVVQNIRGLHDFKMKPRLIRRPHFTSSITGNHFLTPSDFATIYDLTPLYGAGINGSGVSIAVVGQSDIRMSNIQAFRSAAGLPANNPNVIVTGTDPGVQTSTGDESESDLDLEWAGGIAYNANIIFVTSKAVEDAEIYVVDNQTAPILSTSYGLCESQTGQADSNSDASLYQQANAEGITVTAASGDDGAADCDTNDPATSGLAVDEPASLPYVTGVGGTSLSDATGTYWSATNNSQNGSALSYIPEVTWNDSSAANGLSASGGGASIYNSKPSWQTGTGVPADGARDVPDIAFAADPMHDGYLICSETSTMQDCTSGFRDVNTDLDVIGGTSAASPSFAGIVALLVQSLGPQGNINPQLYALAASSSDVFHDIVTGNNVVNCKAGTTGCPAAGVYGYYAGVGYDQTTGLGSIDVAHMVNEWGGQTTTALGTALGFVSITPCRVADTRGITGVFGGPEMSANETRQFYIPYANCNIPTGVAAYALNVTVVPSGPLGYLSIWPSGQSKPLVSTLNSDGRVKANAAIVPAGINGGVSVFASNATNVVLDITGYFVPISTAGLQFYPVTPCRVYDTRTSMTPIAANGTLNVPVANTCNVPSSAQAYSLNFTAIPQGPLGYLSAWPAGQSQPESSVLNAPNGTVTANAAIIAAGSAGEITTYASNTTNLAIDVNGYFAPAGGSGGLSFYALTPCRVLDSRNPAGTAAFSGDLVVNVTGSGCDAPTASQAFVMNATVVPPGILGYLALWPDGEGQPLVSTLNADPTTVTSNLAIIPSTDGSVDAYASQPTYLILDISGYFAP